MAAIFILCMAKQAIYHIKAKDETQQGINSAITSLRNMDKSIGSVGKNLSGLIKFGAVAGGIKLVANQIKQNVTAIGTQQKAELQLARTVQNSHLINGQGLKNLKAYASQLQQNSIYGDELLIGLEAQLVAQGKTEEQVKKIMQASVDLASAGVMPLESAVKNMAKTYSGMSGELGESIPAIKELTSEQMKNGAAVELVAQKYKGMAETVASGVEGQKVQLSNIIGDIRENLGDIWINVVGDFNSKMLPVFSRINDWITEHKERIINLFLNFPVIAKRSFQFAFDYLKEIFSLDYLTSLGSFMWKIYESFCYSTFNTIANYLSAIGITIWEPLKYGFEMVIYGIKSVFVGVINYFINKLNALAEGAHNVAQTILHPIDKSKRTEYTGGIATLSTQIEKPQNNVINNIKSAWVTATEKTKSSLAESVDYIKEGFVDFKESTKDLSVITEGFVDDINETLNTPITLNTDAITQAISSGISSTDTPDDKASEGFDNSAGNLTLSLINGFITGDWAQLITSVKDLVLSIEPLNMVLDPLLIIVKQLLETITPSISNVLTPLIGVVAAVGELLGTLVVPLLDMLVPVLDGVVQAFLLLYNYGLRYLFDGIIWVFNFLHNVVVYIANSIIGFINKVFKTNYKTYSYKDTSTADYLPKITAESITSSGSSYVSDNSSSGGNTATYTGVRDIYVYVTYNVGISAQDDKDIALKIRDLIKEQEKLGY